MNKQSIALITIYHELSFDYALVAYRFFLFGFDNKLQFENKPPLSYRNLKYSATYFQGLRVCI